MIPAETLQALKRYDVVTHYRCGSAIEEMERSDGGEWVRFEDVAAALVSEPSAPPVRDAECTCGSARSESARYGHAHLAWCAAARAVPLVQFVEPQPKTQEDIIARFVWAIQRMSRAQIGKVLGFEFDNHHSALMCPYCNPNNDLIRKSEAAPSVPGGAALLTALMRSMRRWICSSEVNSDGR